MGIGAVDEPVGGMVEFLLKFLELLPFFWPVPCVGRCVGTVDIPVEVNQGLDCLGGQLEGDFILGDHIDMYHIGLDVDHLIVEGLHQRVLILAKLSIWGFGEHHGAQGPDSVGRRQRLCQASSMLGDIVQRALDPVDTLQGRREPWLNLGVQDDIRR